MEKIYDIAIIGAGVTGAVTARELMRYKLSVCILEKESDVAMGATSANSAIVHAGFDAKENSLKARLNVEGSKLMKTLTTELGVKYKNNGSLVIAFNDNDRKTIEELLNRGIKNGVEGLKILEKDELKELEPNISDNAICALYAPTGAIVCPYELTISAIGNAMDNGADLKLDFEVLSIEKDEEYFKIHSGKETVKAKLIINAAGLFADKIAAMVGDNSFTISPRRGEYILLDRDCGNLVSHTIFRTPSDMGKGILISPTVDGNIIVGPTSENIEDKEDKKTTSDGFSKIIKEAFENVDNIKFNKSITSFCGLRAVGSTGDFIITSPVNNFINAGGIESPGLSASPAIARYIIGMLKDMGITLIENESFNPIRKSMTYFRDLSLEEKNEIIKKDKSFGKIVCRCESVTEGEILEAIRTNPKPKTLDGVKRRTRAQMGRCQGGFCMPYIIELLSKELNIPYTAVTKSGKGSIINTGKTKEVY